MKIHILGICGTFMGGLARILVQSGHTVSGSDYQFYPPMSDQLEDLDLRLISGYAADQLPQADLYIIGNNLSRGNESVEKILDKNFPYQSGPRMLGSILQDRKVVAISGTHGKTTTTSLTVHLFKEAGIDVGFLIGGVCNNLEHSAHLGSDDIFVIEADEYDSAFFDKRSKFIHYNPSTLIVNNIEFDHADVLAMIKTFLKF
jgi:UDP-N-acetylmuramate: L-alanyl-gamma-D-glutamyl-meso-diaminopimelate ligase